MPSSSAAGTTVDAGPYGNTPSTANRYSIVHGCYTVKLADGIKRGPYRMQATTLGQYLFYDQNRNFLGDTGAPGTNIDLNVLGISLGLSVGGTPSTLAEVSTPSPSTVWQVDGDKSSGFTVTNLATGLHSTASFDDGDNCAVYPEIGTSSSGNTFKGSSPNGPVTGTIDAHTHVTAFEFLGGDFHCGRPWHPYGVPYALPDCAAYEQGTNGGVEAFEDYGAPAHSHDTRGWPTFVEWPGATKLAEEGTYWTGIERAWLAGLRMMTVDFVDNEALCQVMTTKHNPCNDMQSMQIQYNDLHALQDYIDAQAGGPGKGFFRIVTDPVQARQVINSGKLAVVQGIEMSDMMNCGEVLNVPKCTTADIDLWMTKLWNMGIRSFFPVHKFDNALGGTKMDGLTTGVITNAGNHLETGTYWNIETCKTAMHDEPQLATIPSSGPVFDLLNQTYPSVIGGSLLPVYPPAPDCNTRGLTALGAYVIDKMVKQHFIIELDHMDVATSQAVLSILQADNYAGVVSSHSWDSPEQNPAIYALGGFVTPYAGDADGFVSAWKQDAANHDGRFAFGIGYGSDMNGLGGQGGPTGANPITYPFNSYAGSVTFNRDVWGQRTFDINNEGTANYGLYADWLQALQVRGGTAIMNDLFNGAEAYLEMWQRAGA